MEGYVSDAAGAGSDFLACLHHRTRLDPDLQFLAPLAAGGRLEQRPACHHTAAPYVAYIARLLRGSMMATRRAWR